VIDDIAADFPLAAALGIPPCVELMVVVVYLGTL
jgi:hypothetical protein